MLTEETLKLASGSLPCVMSVIQHPALHKYLCLYFCETLAAAFECLMVVRFIKGHMKSLTSPIEKIQLLQIWRQVQSHISNSKECLLFIFTTY